MAVSAPAAPRSELERLEDVWLPRPGVLGWLTTVDHKRIGLLYLAATSVFFCAGGVEALVMRTQLAQPNERLVGPATYDELFTTHAVTMIFLFVIPMSMGAFGNYLVPLMIGARDMAFPRLNALSFWLFVGSGVFIYVGLFLGDGPNAGWFDYVPLGLRQYDPGLNVDFYALGLIFNGLSSSAAAVNFIVTIFKLRAPGMSLNRMPLFCFANLAASLAIVIALPPLTVDLVFLELERRLGFPFFAVARGGRPLLWQDLFWIFGHPEVYVIVLPAFGIATSVIPTFAQRRMLAFPLVALAELLVVFIGFGVWAHHMFATGLPTTTLVFFAAGSMMVVIPSTIQVFAWTLTVARGRPIFKAPFLFMGGFIVFFVIGGLSGIMFTAIPFDQAATDTYFVVAHLHFVIFGAAVFPLLGGLYYWFPKVTGRMYHEPVAVASFWLTALGTFTTFFPMHIVGLLGMTRRVYTYEAGLGWGIYNLIETVGGFVLAAGLLVIVANLAWSARRGERCGADPFHGGTLEWTLPSPPPHFNFAVIPRVTSAYPNWDRADREADELRLWRDEPSLVGGHLTPSSSPLDGRPAEVVAMPSESAWPILVALCVSAIFALLLLSDYDAAGLVACTGLLLLVGWHAQEPEGEGASGCTASSRAGGRASGRANGWWGMLILLAAEAALVGSIVGSYVYLRVTTRTWPPAGAPQPALLAPLVLAGLLAATLLPLGAALARARRGERRAAVALLGFASAVQLAYLAVQIHLFSSGLASLEPQQSAYASVVAVLLGAAHAHVAIGLLLDAWLLLRLARGLTPYRLAAFEAIRLYWVVVVVIAVAVVATSLSPRL